MVWHRRHLAQDVCRPLADFEGVWGDFCGSKCIERGWLAQKCRHGGRAPNRHVRLQLIAFQNRYDLLDDEIRWLKRAGHLRVTRHELVADTSRMMPIYGWFQIALISLVFGIEKAFFNTSALQAEGDRASASQASIGSLVMEDLAIFAAPR